jgi:hypothetical protein
MPPKKDEKYMQNPKEFETIQTGQNKQTKPKKKKQESKISQVYEMHLKGINVKDIAKKTGLSERVVRAYIWRKKNPEKYQALLKRYFDKRKKKTEQATSNKEKTQHSKED